MKLAQKKKTHTSANSRTAIAALCETKIKALSESTPVETGPHGRELYFKSSHQQI